MNPLHTIDLAALHRMDLEREGRRNWITRSTERPPRRFATIIHRVTAVAGIRASLAVASLARAVRG